MAAARATKLQVGGVTCPTLEQVGGVTCLTLEQVGGVTCLTLEQVGRVTCLTLEQDLPLRQQQQPQRQRSPPPHCRSTLMSVAPCGLNASVAKRVRSPRDEQQRHSATDRPSGG
ncbi:hypothetical protein F2P81_009779 [Scophthalmus maximus]|uniref:Uncharacterized protein n=1 Tax=Scophthalmus maximus TaxID=52904 RepID=A0A6A4SW13_SCOMX|nr:hypothetical protein F2P81_009779 [Scophthalmus maximus]